ncbi:hypothetical protein EDC04DRAFT_2626125 [Pisolithus marmoratus]|nr:hypothetical protein EDC04DRAFT_2626125 [Pisolithus marmoratus]
MLINTLNELATMFFNLTESPWIRAGRQYSVRDLWAHTDNGTADAGDEPEGLSPRAVTEGCISQTAVRIDR